MRILQIVTQMEAAGAQRVAYLLGEKLRNEGHESELLFLYVKRPAYVGEYGISALLDHSPSAVDYIRIVFLLFKFMVSRSPDVLITHTHYSNILGQVVGYLCGVKIRIAVNHSPESLYSIGARVVDRFLGSVGIYSRIVAVSQAVVDSLQDYSRAYKKRLCVIYNGVSLGFYDRDRARIRQKYRLPQDAHLLVNVARLAKEKNQALLLRALARLPSVHLVLIGDGEQREALCSTAKILSVFDRVHMTGELPIEEVHAIVAASDLFVFPSLLEAMPMALVEAMLLEKPILASKTPACIELLGDAGILLPTNDCEAWREAIIELIDNPVMAQRLGDLALKAVEGFTPERMTQNYLALIQTNVPESPMSNEIGHPRQYPS